MRADASGWAALLARAVGLPVELRPVSLPFARVQLFCVSDVDALVDRSRDEDELPYWAHVWPAAVGLAAYLPSFDLRGAPVLELGAGLGLASIAAAMRGAQVTATDLVPTALLFAAASAEVSGAPPFTRVVADWRCFPLAQRYPWILGADILYAPERHDDLARVLRNHLAPGGRAVLADPGRAAADRFLSARLAEGYSLDADDVRVTWEGREHRIDVFVLRAPLHVAESAPP